MLYPNVHVFGQHMRLVDAVSMGVSAVIAWLFMVHFSNIELHWPTPFVAFAITIVVAFVVLAHRLSIYHSRRTERIPAELSALAVTALLSIGVGCFAAQSLWLGLPGPVYLITAVASVVILVLGRFTVRTVLRSLRRRGKDLRWWLLVGYNDRAESIARQIHGHPEYGIRIALVVNTNEGNGAQNSTGLSQLSTLRRHTIGTEEDLRAILLHVVVDEVVVCLPVRSRYDEMQRIIRLCSEAGISVKLPSDQFAQIGPRVALTPVGEIPMVTYWSGPHQHGALLMKRLIDMLVAASAMIALLPLGLLLALLVKLSSGGPVLFKQTRTGLNGREFTMLKLRTMTAHAAQFRNQLLSRNEADGPVFKIEQDPRITAVGRLLRKYHLDELPQLWNVLVGDMSIVGPRPLPLEETAGAEWWQRRRLSVPPGLTCLWQVKGDHRLSFAEWVSLDLRYIDSWSLRLDLRIMLQTVGTLARGTGW